MSLCEGWFAWSFQGFLLLFKWVLLYYALGKKNQKEVSIISAPPSLMNARLCCLVPASHLDWLEACLLNKFDFKKTQTRSSFLLCSIELLAARGGKNQMHVVQQELAE